MIFNSRYLQTSIEFLKGVGPIKADLLKKELNIHNYGDYLLAFPFRYEDRSVVQKIRDIQSTNTSVQLDGTVVSMETISGKNGRKRLTALFKDETGFIELVWFKSIKWVQKSIQPGQQYRLFGKINTFNNKKSIPHPELELLSNINPSQSAKFVPIYHATEKMRSKGIDDRLRKTMSLAIVHSLQAKDIPENLPQYILDKFNLPSRIVAIKELHLPSNIQALQHAQNRIKFEELFFFQLSLFAQKQWRKTMFKGYTFTKIGSYVNRFYHDKLPFDLTTAQKRVIKEIRRDLGVGIQMNRLLQGDVGSGKTIVALISMLIAKDNDFQSCLMAPTEILAQQHYQSIQSYTTGLGLKIAFLSGTVKGTKRKQLLQMLQEGDIDILIGTHALLEDPVRFKNLGLAITDEQHRFGVKQRSKLWHKSKPFPPHILVMTATPIPRTLAMTIYGDLDISIIDELPPGRKVVKTVHKSEAQKGKVYAFVKSVIDQGGQVYFVYPLIEESETLDLQNLQQGYERLLEYFPMPEYQISVVHGKMKPQDKDIEMQRFADGITQIMVATTVIEVGVNVPNASVMIIENAERFGLSQLHQLRGRVGRGADQSYCILSTSFKLSNEAKKRIQTMVSTNDGFKISEVDMEIRGPGSIDGTQQSGLSDLAQVNLITDQPILRTARLIVEKIMEEDPQLIKPAHQPIKIYLEAYHKKYKSWGKIS